MSVNRDGLEAARERIAKAYDPAELAGVGEALGTALAEHFGKVLSGESVVLNWNDPERNVARATEELKNRGSGEAEGTQGQTERFRELVGLILSRGHNLHSPRYLGHQVPATIPVAGYFDAVGQITNQVNAVYEWGRGLRQSSGRCRRRWLDI